MTEFFDMDADGEVTHTRTIDQSSMLACPHFIISPEHYRKDESCRCDDRTHTEMAEWGYTWSEQEGRWQ